MSLHTDVLLPAAAKLVVPLATLGLLALGGCHQAPGASRPLSPLLGRGTLVTEAEIQRMGVRTAWDVVRMRAPYLTSGKDETGRLSQVRIREQRSFNSDETPLLVVDGTRMSDLQYLTELSATELHSIRILDGEAATELYGIGASGGAIVVETKRMAPQPRAP